MTRLLTQKERWFIGKMKQSSTHEQWGYELVRWRRRNLYFGGASAVELREDGSLDAAGDPRRGGHGVVV